MEFNKATLFTKNPPDFSTSETFTFSVVFLLVIVRHGHFFCGNCGFTLEQLGWATGGRWVQTPGLEVPSSSPRARSSQVPGSENAKTNPHRFDTCPRVFGCFFFWEKTGLKHM